MQVKNEYIHGIEVLILESDQLRVSLVPALGGKIISVFNKKLDREFLWSNKDLQLSIHSPGADYDSNFIGGIDELLPNDIPEPINGINYPDHGELWTTHLQHEVHANSMVVYGDLPLSALHYSKTISVSDSLPEINLAYKIKSNAGEPLDFMWKLHAALTIKAGDKIITSATKAKVADPEYCRFKQVSEFSWPEIENTNASIIPAKNGSMDFFYLYNTPTGELQLLSTEGYLFSYTYDTNVFPYQWIFASYGGFLGHYTAILEPCTTMPISVNEAKALKQTATLNPGESLETTVKIFAGEKKRYINK